MVKGKSSLSAMTDLAGSRIGSVNVCAPVLPHCEEGFPYRRYNVGGPEGSGLCVSRSLDLMEISLRRAHLSDMRPWNN
jgi:hypothetical protein